MSKANTSKNKVLLAAGGTGGHMFPASVLAEQLKVIDYEVHLATDTRGLGNFIGSGAGQSTGCPLRGLCGDEL